MENGTNGNGGRGDKGKFAPGHKFAEGHKGAGGRPRKELEVTVRPARHG